MLIRFKGVESEPFVFEAEADEDEEEDGIESPTRCPFIDFPGLSTFGDME